MPIRSRPKPGSPRPAEALPSAAIADPRGVSEALEAWFPAAARDLPWRRHRSGYGALVSELMLQQTQVGRVIDAFARFMERFPTPCALADASEHDVLAAWQGLGYYRRARLLHGAARAVRDLHGGTVPATAAELQALPGIGRYTAGAIASIVHGERVPIVDGNVLRVVSRLAAHPAQAGSPPDERWAWREASRLVEAADRPGVLNEGLMELGATVCTPAAPKCGSCPLRAQCQARAAGSAADIPRPRRAAPRRAVHWHALVDVGPGGVALERRPERGLWAGMLQPPTVEADAPVEAGGLERAWGMAVREVGAFTHVTSHRDVHFRVFVPAAAAARPDADGVLRVPAEQLASQPLSNAAWRVLEAARVPVRTPPSASAGRAARSAPTGS
ncbi:MAG: A/G-specific adenine glycosylase [Planctomycetota bacterium]